MPISTLVRAAPHATLFFQLVLGDYDPTPSSVIVNRYSLTWLPYDSVERNVGLLVIVDEVASILGWIRSVVLWTKVRVSRIDECGHHLHNTMYNVSKCRVIGQFRRAFCEKASQRVALILSHSLSRLSWAVSLLSRALNPMGSCWRDGDEAKRRNAPVGADRNSAGRQAQSVTSKCRSHRVFGCSPKHCRPLRTRCRSSVQITPEAVFGWIAHETSVLSS